MSDWTTLREYPLDQDLSELARFIRRCRLPLRISEEGNRQCLSTPDPRLADLLLPLLDRWSAGEINLDQVRVEPVAADTAAPVPPQSAGDGGEAEPVEGAQPPEQAERAEPAEPVDSTATESPLPSWPWRRTPLSLLLIALCFVGWLLVREDLWKMLVIFPERGGDFELGNSTLAWHLAHGEYWRLWTPALVHFSFMHALFNAMGLWILGRPLEARGGTPALAALVLISAPVSNLVQYLWMPQIPFGGMSGVLYAIAGAVLVLQRRFPRWRDVPAGLVGMFVVWMLVCASGLVTLIFGVGVANAAHLGGFACGLLLALLYCLAGGDKRFAAALAAEKQSAA